MELFDINRSLKENFKIIKKTSFILDVLFWIVITLIVFIVVNTISKFQLRYYHFVALAVGFILYYTPLPAVRAGLSDLQRPACLCRSDSEQQAECPV